METIQWEHYPYVANHGAARAFVERLVLKGKRPKTVDAYARAVEDLLAYFSTTAPERLLEGAMGREAPQSLIPRVNTDRPA